MWFMDGSSLLDGSGLSKTLASDMIRILGKEEQTCYRPRLDLTRYNQVWILADRSVIECAALCVLSQICTAISIDHVDIVNR